MAHALTSASQPVLRHGALDREPVWQARVDLAACFRGAARLGLHEGICNHLSAMVPGSDELFLVNPYGWGFHEITASRLLVCDFHGRVVDGAGEPLMPCGRCRQLLYEHSAAGMMIKSAGGIMTIEQMLPDAFGPERL